ncbi:MAG: aldehyde ferredoxin oxidoreductase family protein [Desulfitobacteriaceae bacterium]
MKLLRVNMAELEIRTEQVKEDKYLGGRAFIARFLLNEVKPQGHPLGKYNKLIFAPGLLGGSKVMSSGRISIGAKSPLTGGVKESNGGGVAGLKLGRLEYQAVIVEDIPQGNEKYLLRITAKGAELLPAGKYWGMGVYQAVEEMRLEFGEHVAISCIGPAGERQFLAAGIANTDVDGVPSRYSGRGGLGAVMGAKGIKALIIDDSGVKVTEPVRPEEFRQAIQEYTRLLKESSIIESYRVYGTAGMVNVTNAQGGLPTRNFSTGRYSGAEKISGEKLREVIMDRHGKPSHACMPGCLIQCSNVYVDKDGKAIVAPLEYETIALMGSNLEIDDLDVIARLNYLCNDYGVDTIEIGASLGVAMASGLIPFGDKEGAIRLVEEIGKGTLTGRVLGMGAATTGKVLGVSEVPQAKGQAMPGYEPRAFKGLGVTYATSPMGADHTAGSMIRAQVNHASPDGKAELSKKMQYIMPVYDSLGLCMFVSPALGAYPEVLRNLVNAQLGTDLSVDSIFQTAKDCLKWEREFNRRAGFTREDDRLPEHFSEVPNPAVDTVFDVSEEDLDGVHN